MPMAHAIKPEQSLLRQLLRGIAAAFAESVDSRFFQTGPCPREGLRDARGLQQFFPCSHGYVPPLPLYDLFAQIISDCERRETNSPFFPFRSNSPIGKRGQNMESLTT